MASFKDLSEQDRIQYVKDEFITILEDMAKDKGKIDKYLPLEDAKSYKSAKGTAEYTKEYEERKSQRNKVMEIVGSLSKRKDCVCGSCLDLNINGSALPPEMEFIIDVAKKEAESKSY